MISLNLLPPQEKKSLALEKIQRWIVFYGSNILGILIIAIALLSIIWLSVSIELKSASENLTQTQSGIKGQDLQTQQSLIKKLNGELKAINGLQKNQRNYSSLLTSLAGLIPSGVRLTNLNIDEKNSVSLSGHAEKREDVINFQNSIERSGFFENIENPLENLVKQTNINFGFRFTIKNSALTQ